MHYLQMLKNNIPLLPCIPETKLPARRKGTFTVKDDFKGWVRTEEEFKRETPTTCWAVNPGNGGWMALDIDTKEGKDGLNNLRAYLKEIGQPDTIVDQLIDRSFPALTVTPSGGIHAFFKYSGDKKFRKAHLAKNKRDVEFFHAVGYIIAPGSKIPGYGNGEYVFHGNIDDAYEAPQWVIDRFVENEQARTYNEGMKKRFRGRRFNAKIVWADLEQKRDRGTIEGMNMQLFIFGSAASEGNADPEDVENFLTNAGIDVNNHKIRYALRNMYIPGKEDDDYENPFTSIDDVDLTDMPESEREKIIKQREAKKQKEQSKKEKDSEASEKAAERELRYKKLVEIYKKTLDTWRYVEGQKSFVELSKRSVLLDKEQMDDRFSCDVRDCTGEEKTFSYLFRYYPEIIKRVDNMQYWPGQEAVFIDNGKTYINTWEPSTLKAEKGDIQWFIDHLAYIYDNNQEYIDTFLNWAAHIIQEPSDICVWNPWIQSAVEGTGKSMIANIIRKLVGEENSTVITATDIASSYNGWAARKLVIIEEMDEAKAWGSLADKLKHLATSDKIRIDDKYVRPYDTHNCLQFMLLSNKEVPMKITGDARRWFIHKMQSGVRTEEYYNQLSKHIEEDTGAVLFFLQNRDLSAFGFNPKRLKVETEAKRDLLHASKNDQHKEVERLCFNLIHEKTEAQEHPLFIQLKEILPEVNRDKFKDHISESFAGSILSNMRDDDGQLIFLQERIKSKGARVGVYMFGLTRELYTTEPAAEKGYSIEDRDDNRKKIRAEIRAIIEKEITDEFTPEQPKEKKAKILPIGYKIPEHIRQRFCDENGENVTSEEAIPF